MTEEQYKVLCTMIENLESKLNMLAYLQTK